MDRLFAYVLLVLLVIATWNDSLSSRLNRLLGNPAPEEVVTDVSATTETASVAKRTPFWQQPGYRNALEPTKKDKKH